MDLRKLMEKPRKLVIGLMSGTSADGIDAVLLEIEGHGLQTVVHQLAFSSLPFTDEIRQRILEVASGSFGGSDHLCRLNFLLGGLSADACQTVCMAAGIPLGQIDLVGSHGQTVFHAPLPEYYLGKTFRSTLQIGEPSVIAERMGCPVVSDFRVRDIAAGGQGAPLVPYTEFLLYRDPDRTIALQNIGGIGNITILPKGGQLEDLIAFDTGPGNMVMDALASLATDGRLRFDDDGHLASCGNTCQPLLDDMLQDPYIAVKPPKTTGREKYGTAYVAWLCKRGKELGLSYADLLATATRFTAETIRESIRRFCPIYPDRMIVGGGGSRNPVLMRHIGACLPLCEVLVNEDIGLDSQSKEAVAFAILANETIHGNPNNATGATGAAHPVVMGKICF